jgi:hypothetical protein
VASTFETRPCRILLVCQNFDKIIVGMFVVNNFRRDLAALMLLSR